MIPLSARYAPQLLALLALALVPVAVHSYAGGRNESCRDPGALAGLAARAGGQPEASERPHDPRQITLWSEGSLASGRSDWSRLDYQIIRSFEPSLVLPVARHLLPEFFVPDEARLTWIDDAGPRLPIHWVYDTGWRHRRFVAVLFAYGTQPIRTPFLAQLRAAPRNLLSGPRPLTVFWVSGVAPDGLGGKAESAARDWLARAFAAYQSVCAT